MSTQNQNQNQDQDQDPAPKMYPNVNTSDLNNLVHQPTPPSSPSSSPAVDETLLRIPGAMLHLIDQRRSVELSTGEFSLHHLSRGPDTAALFASVSLPNSHDSVQWPITHETPAVKLDSSHYFFSLPATQDDDDDNNNNNNDDSNQPMFLNYGLTLAFNGQESMLAELDEILSEYSSFNVHEVNENGSAEVLDLSLVKQMTAREVAEGGPKKELIEERTAAYWTTLAPNVEEYSGSVAKGIAKGSGQVVKGIIWCGDVTADRIKWGNEFLKRKLAPGEEDAEVSPDTLKRIQR